MGTVQVCKSHCLTYDAELILNYENLITIVRCWKHWTFSVLSNLTTDTCSPLVLRGAAELEFTQFNWACLEILYCSPLSEMHPIINTVPFS